MANTYSSLKVSQANELYNHHFLAVECDGDTKTVKITYEEDRTWEAIKDRYSNYGQ